MSATNAAENAVLELIFKNTDWANVGDAAGLQNSATAGSFYLSLHTADPGEGGSQTTNETAYTSYARVAVARSGAGWTITNDSVSPAATITFPEATGGTATITHMGIGTDSSGAGNLIWKGAVTPNISVSTGVTPRLTTSTAITAA
jgi:hypothetical protein